MVFEQIEALKRQYTDRYVVVDETRPELRRFRGQTGTVRTVNMSGKALVEFDAHENIGWFDIDPDFLRIIDEPLPKPEQEERGKAATKQKPSSEKKAASDKTAGAKPAAKSAAKKPATGMSVEEMLAAARGEKKAAATTTAAKAPPAKTPKPAAGTAGKMSVEEMLAAARAEKSAAPATAPKAEPEPAEAVEPPAQVEEEPAAAAAPAATDLPKTTEGILAYCRQVDGSSSIRSSATSDQRLVSSSTSMRFTTLPAARFSRHQHRCARSIRYMVAHMHTTGERK